MKNNYIVYMHKNKCNNKVYIGKTCQNIEKIWSLKGKNYQNNIKFYNDIKFFGWDNFEHVILQQNLTHSEAKTVRNSFINRYNSILEGYNVSLENVNTASEIGPGRPVKDRSSKIIIGFETTKPLKIRLEEEANKLNKSISALIREILERHYEER